MHMDEKRSERFSVNLTPSELAKLDAYAAEHRWSRSTAAAEAMQRGIDASRAVLEAHYSYESGKNSE